MYILFFKVENMQEKEKRQKDKRARDAERVLADKTLAEEVMLKVQRLMREERRDPVEGDLLNSELVSLIRYFAIPNNGAKVKSTRFKVWYDYCVAKNLFEPTPPAPTAQTPLPLSLIHI